MRKSLNDRRLTKKQVAEILAAENGVLHVAYSSNSAHGGLDLVYELPGDRFLYVFNPNGVTLPGKGDIYPGDYFRRFMNWGQQVENDFAKDRGSSVAHWYSYSMYKNELFNYPSELLRKLASELEIEIRLLDKKYPSLDLLSTKLEQYGREQAYANLYDSLVFYVGEVIRLRIGGDWNTTAARADKQYPFIEVLGVQYMPINAVWSAICGIDKINLRGETTKLIRENGWALKSAQTQS